MNIDMKWFIVLLIVIAALSLMRIVSKWRSFGRRTSADWDEQFITQLRKAGVNPFEEHAVDFFFTMPDDRSSGQLKTQLVADGFEVIADHANPDGGHSLDVQRRMRLVVPEMQALTKRFHALAAGLGGKYDNWAVANRPTR